MLVYHLIDFKQEDFNVLAMKVVKILKDLSNEKEKNKEKLKKLEVDKKFKEIEVLRKKIAETDAKKAKEMEEKLIKIRESGFDSSQAGPSEGIVEKYVKETVKRTEEQTVREVKFVDYLNKDEKSKEKLEKIIETKVGEYREDLLDEAQAKKSDEAMKKEFYDKISKFDEKSLTKEYETVLASLSQLYGRRTLVNILSHTESQEFLIS